MCQSAATWFQLASRTSAPASYSSDAENDYLATSSSSEGAIARIVVGGLAEARKAARNPVGGPVDQPRERNGGIAEQPHRLRRVDQPAFARLDTGEHRGLAQAGAEALRQPAHTHRLRAADVERA